MNRALDARDTLARFCGKITTYMLLGAEGRQEGGGGEGGWSACSRQTHLQHQEMGDCELEELTMGGEVRLLEGRCSGGCKEVRGIKRGRSRQAARS